MMALPDAENV